MQRTLLILGMHRSGTSLVTQWLFRCGLQVGDNLLGASTGNTEGHYEDEDFLSLHQDWLINRGLIHTGLIAEAPSPLQGNEVQQLKKLIAQKNVKNEQWGFKEPRTCLWLPIYRQCAPYAYSLIVIRNFNDTVNSLVMREFRMEDKIHDRKVQTKKGLSKLKWHYLKRKRPGFYFRQYAEEYLRVLVHYYECIVEHCKTLPTEKYIMVSYEDLLKNDKAVFEHLTKRWGFKLQSVPFRNVFKKELLSNTRNISHYIQDKALLAKAHELEDYCKKLSQAHFPFAS